MEPITENTSQVFLREALKRKFIEIKCKNPSFSLRAYALRLMVSPSVVSEIFNGKRQVSREYGEQLLSRLQLKESGFTKSISSQKATSQNTVLDFDRYETIAEWHHFAILSLVKTVDFRNDVYWIAQRLGIKTIQAKNAVQRLLKLGILEEKDGNLKRRAGKLATPDGIPNAALRYAHLNNLKMASLSMQRDPMEFRDFYSITCAIDPKRLPQAKRRLRKALQSVSDCLETESPSEVYKICIQVFPLSRKTKVKRKKTDENN